MGYEQEADKLKTKYEKDLAAFLKAGGEIQPRKAKKEKKVKDPNRPKRAQTSYMLWLADSRAKIVKSLPKGAAVTDVAKAAGVEWKALTGKAKVKYEQEADKLKNKYEKDLAAFLKAGGEIQPRKSKKEKKVK